MEMPGSQLLSQSASGLNFPQCEDCLRESEGKSTATIPIVGASPGSLDEEQSIPKGFTLCTDPSCLESYRRKQEAPNYPQPLQQTVQCGCNPNPRVPFTGPHFPGHQRKNLKQSHPDYQSPGVQLSTNLLQAIKENISPTFFSPTHSPYQSTYRSPQNRNARSSRASPTQSDLQVQAETSEPITRLGSFEVQEARDDTIPPRPGITPRSSDVVQLKSSGSSVASRLTKLPVDHVHTHVDGSDHREPLQKANCNECRTMLESFTAPPQKSPLPSLPLTRKESQQQISQPPVLQALSPERPKMGPFPARPTSGSKHIFEQISSPLLSPEESRDVVQPLTSQSIQKHRLKRQQMRHPAEEQMELQVSSQDTEDQPLAPYRVINVVPSARESRESRQVSAFPSPLQHQQSLSVTIERSVRSQVQMNQPPLPARPPIRVAPDSTPPRQRVTNIAPLSVKTVNRHYQPGRSASFPSPVNWSKLDSKEKVGSAGSVDEHPRIRGRRVSFDESTIADKFKGRRLVSKEKNEKNQPDIKSQERNDDDDIEFNRYLNSVWGTLGVPLKSEKPVSAA